MDIVCPSCGARSPDVGDAFCPECREPFDEPVQPVKDPAGAPGAMVGRHEPSIATAGSAYEEVPWHRRSGPMSAFILVGFFLFPPLLWMACVICLTGDVYNNRVKKDGTLARWSAGNKVAAVIILVLQSLGLAYRLGAFGS